MKQLTASAFVGVWKWAVGLGNIEKCAEIIPSVAGLPTNDQQVVGSAAEVFENVVVVTFIFSNFS